MQAWCRFAAEASTAASAGGSAPGSSVTALARQKRAPAVTPPEPFRTTSRWLRGRILDRLRDATGGTWVTFDEAIGDHDPVAVAGALDRLARERLVELRGSSVIEARLPEA
jgi:hypothetical protein